MTAEMIVKINKYCNRYGDKLVELMDRCGAPNLPSVPNEDALKFLKELEARSDYGC